MYLFGHELLRQEVQEADTGRVIGRVSRIVWDPTRGHLVGLMVEGPPSRLINQQEIQSIQPGRIVISPESVQTAQDEPLPSERGKHLMTDEGHDLGMVEDVVFDPASRQLLAFEVLRGETMWWVPALPPIRELPNLIILPAAAEAKMASDLSVLSEVRETKTGNILFPLSEEPGE